MTRRLWLMLLVVAFASLLPGVAVAEDVEPYSGGEVTATTLDVPVTTLDPSATVLGNTLGRGGEQLPNTGAFQSGWLAAGGFLLIVVGVSLVWIVRSRTDA